MDEHARACGRRRLDQEIADVFVPFAEILVAGHERLHPAVELGGRSHFRFVAQAEGDGIQRVEHPEDPRRFEFAWADFVGRYAILRLGQRRLDAVAPLEGHDKERRDLRWGADVLGQHPRHRDTCALEGLLHPA